MWKAQGSNLNRTQAIPNDFFCCRHFLQTNVGLAPWLTPLNAELNPICHLLALLLAHPILHFSEIRVKSATTSFHLLSNQLFTVQLIICHHPVINTVWSELLVASLNKM